jgi:hypothetical protein
LQNHRSLFEELSKFSGSDLETRAENAFIVGDRFIKLLRDNITDDKTFDLIMKAWFRAVKDGDFNKFKRVYRKHTSQ